LSINTLQACDPEFLFSEEMERIIAETLQSLPKKTRQIFVLNRFEGLSYHEIAEKMNLSGKTIEYHISRALRELRISLKYLYIVTPFLVLFC
jgi:RNA polymerase sigma-70 factor (ECF subfamily)